jgi:hypothetical protein
MVMMMAIGVPVCFQAAQTLGGGELGKDQCNQMVQAAKRLVVGSAL